MVQILDISSFIWILTCILASEHFGELDHVRIGINTNLCWYLVKIDDLFMVNKLMHIFRAACLRKQGLLSCSIIL